MADLRQAEELLAKGEYKEALRLYKKLRRKNRGNPFFVARIGDCHYGRKKYKKALKFYGKAADKKCPRGYTGLGKCNYLGRGCPIDDEKARRYFEKAAKGHDREGTAYLGYFYENGLGGLPVDGIKAHGLYLTSIGKKTEDLSVSAEDIRWEINAAVLRREHKPVNAMPIYRS